MSWLTDRRLWTAALAVWVVLALIGLVLGPSLGHDEAAFAITSRGEQPPGVWLYRSDGTVWIARLGTALGDAAWLVRLPSALVNALAIVAAYAVGRAAFDARTGAWTAAILAGAHPMGLRAAELLSDLPGMACVLGGIAILAGEMQRPDGPRWRLVAAGPVFAAAFYVRYGSAPAVAIAIAAAVLLWWRAALRRPLPIVAMAAAIGVLLIPHFLRSHEATGSYFGILDVSRGMPRRAYVGEGLVTYLASNPFLFYGALVAPVMVAGLVGLATARRRVSYYLAVVALGQITMLGIQSHGQPRYVYVATALLVVLGVDYLRHRFPWPRPRVALALVAAAQLGLVVATVIHHRVVDDARAPIVAAAETMRAHSAGKPCAAVAAIVPQLMWYSRCSIFASSLIGPDSLPPDRDGYAVWLKKWPMDAGAFAAQRGLTATPLPTGDDRARVWRLR
ncbi:MAG: glycosyltransferase family 39 protein [Deltaproteobacteria bacterium]|nr:glycosyltransferase family 39 protein [Deltaproteobacteria bacterium]